MASLSHKDYPPEVDLFLLFLVIVVLMLLKNVC